MSSTSILPSSYGADTPRVARRAAPWRGHVRHAGSAIWRVLESWGRARAQGELRALHDRVRISDPALARQLRDAHAFLATNAAPNR